MKSLCHFAGAISLLTFVAGAFGQADQAPKLPDQYAQVVLRVKGMT